MTLFATRFCHHPSLGVGCTYRRCLSQGIRPQVTRVGHARMGHCFDVHWPRYHYNAYWMPQFTNGRRDCWLPGN